MSRKALAEARAAAEEARRAADAARARAEARAAATEKAAAEERAARRRDTDGDGLDDFADACPDKPGTVSNQGCPDPDRDRDGIVDRLDNCPDRNGTAANKGCTSKQKVSFGEQPVLTTLAGKVVGVEAGEVRVEHDDGTIGSYLIAGRAAAEKGEGLPQGISVGRVTVLETTEAVSFKRGAGAIDKKSQGLLDQVALVMVAHGEIARLIVEVRTDERNSAEANRSLAVDRANAVVKQLAAKGVEGGRLEARGEAEVRSKLSLEKKSAREPSVRVRFIVVR